MIIWRVLRWIIRIAFLIAALAVVAGIFLQATNPKPSEREGWGSGPPLTDGRGEVASTVADGKLVVVGGLRGLTTVSNAVSILEPDGWETGPEFEGLHHAAAAAIGKTVYVTGGASSVRDWTPSKAVYAFVVGSDKPPVAAEMPEGRQGHAMVAIGDKLYIVGGVGETARTIIADTAQKKWKLGAPIPQPRDHLRAVVMGEKVWAIGGRVGGEPTKSVDIYDPAKDSWRPGPPLPEAMSAMAVGVLGKNLHVIGGEDPDIIGGGVTHSHFVLRSGRDDWERESTPPLPVHGAGYGVIADTLIVTGGASRQGALSVLSWTDITQLFRD